MHPAAGLDPEPDSGCRAVRHQHRYGEHRDLPQAFGLKQVVLGEQGVGAADPGADDGAEPLEVQLRGAGVGPCLPGSDQRDLLAAVEPSGLHPWQDLRRFDGQLGLDPHRQFVLLHPGIGERGDAASPGEHALPGLDRCPAQWGGRADSGDDDSLFAHGLPLVFRAVSGVLRVVPSAPRSPDGMVRGRCAGNRGRPVPDGCAGDRPGLVRCIPQGAPNQPDADPVRTGCARCNRPRRRPSSGWPARRPGS